MRSTLKILLQLLHIGKRDPVPAEGLKYLTSSYFGCVKIIYNKHKSDGINSEVNVKFYEIVIKKTKQKSLKKTSLLG